MTREKSPVDKSVSPVRPSVLFTFDGVPKTTSGGERRRHGPSCFVYVRENIPYGGGRGEGFLFSAITAVAYFHNAFAGNLSLVPSSPRPLAEKYSRPNSRDRFGREE